MITVKEGLLLGLALFLVFGVLAAWSDESASCDGTVVRNFWGYPTCVEAGDQP